MIACRTINDYDREFLKDQMLTALGTAWWDRDEAIGATTRHLGFARTGSQIDEALRSCISGLLRQDRLEAGGTMIRRTKPGSG